jgi:hypothetical protein
MENVILNCEFCNYTTNRKFNLKRHHNAFHNVKTPTNDDREKVVNFERKHIHFDEKPIHFEEKHIENDSECLYCSKCAKKYKTKKYLVNHEENCIGLNILTCKRCMFTFSSKASKSVHTRRNKCKAKSIINAVNPDLKYNIVNNFGSERTDYITFDDMIKIFSNNNIIPKYIEFKYFNKKFPENHNIKFEKYKGCLIKQDDEWKITDIKYLTNKLIDTNLKELEDYYNSHKEDIGEKDIFDFNKNNLKIEIKNIIKTTMLK